VVAGSNPVAPTRFLVIEHMATYLLYLIAARLIHIVHPRVADGVACIIAFLFYIFRPRIRHNVKRNIEALNVPAGSSFVVFRNFSMTIGDFLWFSRTRRNELSSYCRIEGREHLDRALGGGKGVIVITAHLGPWEIAGACLASLGYRIHTVALPHPSNRVTRFFSKRRAEWGIHDYPFGESIPPLLRALRMNEIVVLLVDRNYSARGITLPFLGRDVTLPDGHIILAKRTGAALLPASCYYENKRSVTIRIEDPVRVEGAIDDPAAIGVGCLHRIERHIRMHYEQWFAFDHLWPEK
jgi:lauroyl/myristoyl acyltransferase